MKKKLPVVTVGEREEAARLEGLPGEVTLALADIVGAMREGLMAMSCTAGLPAVIEINGSRGDRAGWHQRPARSEAHRHPQRHGTRIGRPRRRDRGDAPAPGGPHRRFGRGRARLLRTAQLPRPPQPTGGGADASWRGATRRHVLVAEPVDEAIEEAAKAKSNSAVSRRFVRAT
jgi:hypothetical protein